MSCTASSVHSPYGLALRREHVHGLSRHLLLNRPCRPPHSLALFHSAAHASTPRTRSPTSDPPTCGPMSQPRSRRVYSHHSPSVSKGVSASTTFSASPSVSTTATANS